MKENRKNMVLKGITEGRKRIFKERLQESIQQSKKGKGRIISTAELNKMVEN